MISNAVFLDTCGWVALLNASDDLHAAATAAWRVLGQRGRLIVLADWVLAETGNGLARTPARSRFVNAVQLIESSPRAQLIRVSDELRERALAQYADRADKAWGLVDCASFIVMQDHGMSEAFTNDRHFQQAGFSCLLPLP